LAERIGVADGSTAIAAQNGTKVTLPVIIDNHVADFSVLIHAGLEASASLDASFTPVTIEPAE
jgi:hypothetical protein